MGKTDESKEDKEEVDEIRLVIVESPYGTTTPEDVAVNKLYGRQCMADCIQRGESPYASHLLLTQDGVLDDNIPGEREKGIAAGFAWRAYADCTVVYTDLGISTGMQLGIEHANDIGCDIEYRRIELGKD